MTQLEMNAYALNHVGMTPPEVRAALDHPTECVLSGCQLCLKFGRYLNIKDVLAKWEASKEKERDQWPRNSSCAASRTSNRS